VTVTGTLDLPAEPKSRLRLAAATSLLAAAGMGLALAWPALWTGAGETGEYRVGLVKLSMCVGTTCKSGGLALLGDSAATWGRLGAATFVAAGLAALAHLAAAVLALRGGAGRWYRPRLAGLLSLLAFSLAAAFAVAAPDLGLEVGPAFFALFGGAAIGIGSGVLLHPAPSMSR
jgi:hypothetical protein